MTDPAGTALKGGLRHLRRIGVAAAAVSATFLAVPLSVAGTPPGAPITNRAAVNYDNLLGQPATVYSNEVVLRTEVVRTPAVLTFVRSGSDTFPSENLAPTQCFANGSYIELPVPGGDTALPLVQTSNYNAGEVVYLRLEDADQNADYQLVEYVDVDVGIAETGDAETLRLFETGANTGVFAGYVPSSTAAARRDDCVLQAAPESLAEARYTDPVDAADEVEAVARFDPLGIAFDSRTGSFLDGVRITLVDAASGNPVTVYGNDGVSQFPSTVQTGQVAVDESGQRYDLSGGRFRFPVVPAGTYRLQVEAPEDYRAPSLADPADLQALPGAPFDISAASFSEPFEHDGLGPFAVDYPLDPISLSLFVRKTTTATEAAPGDFIPYEIVITNRSATDTAFDVKVTDVLPARTRYVPGTATLNGQPIPDPDITAATTLEFAVGDLDPDAQVSLGYVLEIIGGSAGDVLRNSAFATADPGIVSNEAVAGLRMREDLFRTTSTLIGRIVAGSCTLDGYSDDQGIAGIRVYLEDGRYAVSDESGRYHFEGLPVGTHVAQLDTGTIPEQYEVTACEQNGRFGGRGDSQFVELSAGSLRRADFYLAPRQASKGTVELSMQTSGSEVRDRVVYDIELTGSGAVSLRAPQVSVLLPDGVRYRAGTLQIDGEAQADPRIAGPAVIIDLDDLSGDWKIPIRFEADIEAHIDGELTTRAVASFGSEGQERLRTPVAETIIRREPATWENTGYVLALRFDVLSAELSAKDRATLDAIVDAWSGVRDLRIFAAGHSDSTRIAARNRHLFADNYALSKARAASAARYLAEALGVPQSHIQVDGRGPDEPVAANDTEAGRGLNRRVEIVLAGSRAGRQSFITAEKPSSGRLLTETRGAQPGQGQRDRQAGVALAQEEHLAPPSQPSVSIESLQPGTGWVTPAADFRPAIPAMRVAIRHATDQTVTLFVNGLEVEPVNYAGTESDGDRNVAVSRWSGVELLEGTNQLTADVIGPDGLVADRLTRRIHHAGTAVRAELVDDRSVLVADGKTRPVLAVRLFDRFGEPARHSSVGEYSVAAPYRSSWEIDRERENDLVQLSRRNPLYTVGDDGIAYVELEPTTDSGQVTLHVRLSNQREQEINAWLQPAARDWILVGFAEGTLGYTTLDNEVQASRDGHRDGYYEDGRLAFFAKGSIRGKYLLTLAYDSARDRSLDDQRFQSEIDPNAWYTIYADNTEQRFEAASQRRLYVKLERQQFNALFGDFSTGLSMTELTRYERRMNGLRSEYAGRNVAYTVFASDNNQSFVRDELQGDGTSGLYRLSEGPVIPQSETVRIETRDRFDQALVLSTRTLSRFLDYSLDPVDGTIFFKQPVPSRDDSFNPVFIIVEYETASDTAEELTAGGRVAVRSTDRRFEVGLTHIEEQQPALSGELTGADLRWQMTPETLLRAEVATSTNDDGSGPLEGSATHVAVEHRGEKLDLRAGFTEADQDFGLGQQPVPRQGIRRVAVDARYTLNSEIAVRTEASVQDNLETGAERQLVLADVEYRSERSTARIGVIRAEDSFSDGERRKSSVIDAGVSRRLFDSALSLRANGSFSLDGMAESADYPASYVFGMDYTLRPEVDLFVEYENAEGKELDAEMTRVGVRASPWSRAQVNSSVSNETTEFGPRLYSNLGLVQAFQLNDHWMLDVGLDQTRTLREAGLRNFDEERELASGSYRDDFTAGYVGTLFQAASWSVNTRLEYRDADTERRATFLSGWYREPSRGHGLSAGMTVFQSSSDAGGDALRADLRVGWALRRSESPWSLLYRADVVFEERDTVATRQSIWRVISNLNANRRFAAASELSLQYASKYVSGQFADVDVHGYTDLTGVDLRRGFAERWELAMHGSVYHAWRADVLDYAAGLSFGYNLSEDLWISVGYNVTGFRDADFAAARYTASGPFLTLVARGHQASLKRITGR